MLVISLLLMALWSVDPAPVVKVDGQPLDPAGWRFLVLTRGVEGSPTPEMTRRLIDQWIDRALIRRQLAKEQAAANPDLVELRQGQLWELIERRQTEPAALLAKLGLSVEQVRAELELAAAWEGYIERAVSAEELRSRFERERSVYDGTRVRARHLFRKGTTAEEVAAARELLERVRGEIVGGRMTFAAAAREHSQAPTRAREGDVGWVVGLGQLPEPVCRAALVLMPGEVSPVVISPLGVHLVTVTEREPGELSPEDARAELLTRIATERWDELAKQLRAKARIERP